MKVSLKLLPYVSVLLFLTAVTVGCVNIFGFANDKEKAPVAKAEEEIRNGNYAKAKEELAELIEREALEDSTYIIDSMILYTYAKATLLDAGIDLATIVTIVQGEEEAETGFNNPILQKIDELTEEEQTAWYQSNTDVIDILEKIYKNQTTGIFTKEDIALDYSIANILSSVLSLRDTNQDTFINYTGEYYPEKGIDIRLDLISSGDDGGFVLGNIETDEAGNPVLDENNLPKNSGLKVFLGDWSGEAAKPSAISVKKHDHKPDDINHIINFILNKLDKGEESIKFLLKMYDDPDDEASSFDYGEIEQYIIDIGKFINYYWYDDGIDNDGDGLTDEETINGEDDDGDDLIDEDTDHHPYDESKKENTQYNKVFEDWANR